MCVILRSSGGLRSTELKSGMILYWTSLYGLENTSRYHDHYAVHKCKLKLYHAKKKPCVNTIHKRCHLLWVKAHLKWFEAKWKSVPSSDESKFEILFGKHGRSVLQTKEERDYLACNQWTVHKAVSLCIISANGMGNLHILKKKKDHQCWREHKF